MALFVTRTPQQSSVYALIRSCAIPAFPLTPPVPATWLQVERHRFDTLPSQLDTREKALLPFMFMDELENEAV